MTGDDSWEPKPLGKDYATMEEVEEVAGVMRGALYAWLREGLLPEPVTTGGRGNIAKWPLVTLKIAKFIRSQRDLGFGLQEMRDRIVEAFGERVLEVLAEPVGVRPAVRPGGKKLTNQRKKKGTTEPKEPTKARKAEKP